MEPAVLGGKLASALLGPLVRKLFRADGPGAGLVDKPVQLSALVSFRGEKRTLSDKDVHRLAARLVTGAVASPGEPPFPADEEAAVTDALAARLLALGDLDMDDVQAVRLGHRELAARLGTLAPVPGHLAADSTYFLDSATEWACLHILEFFTRRSTFVARTLVEQTRSQAELIARVDELISRVPRPDAGDTAFERRYRQHVTDRYNHITIYGIDLLDSRDRWPLEVAYLSLEATVAAPEIGTDGQEWWTVNADGTFGTPRTIRLAAEDVLSGNQHLVLLRGDAGSGKTTLVQWLAVTAARDGDLVPYVLPLRSLVRAGELPPPSAFLNAVGCPHTPPAGWAERVLATRRGLLLVDGLDEIPDADRRRARDWLVGLGRAFPGNRWLLTSRPTAVRVDWLSDEGFEEVTLSPMGRPEVATFVRRWHAAARAPQFEESLLDSLRTKRDLARLATNPLMCGLICALHRERRGYLPTGRAGLYDAALTMLLARRDRERGIPDTGVPESGAGPLPSEEARREVLQRLAYAMVLSGRTEMDQETAVGLVERCLPAVVPGPRGGPGEAEAVLNLLLLRTGLLRRPAPGVVDFVHRTFQDYLGARHAVEEGHLDVLVAHAADAQWEDVVRMSVAHARPRERATLINGLLSLRTPRSTLLALACLEHAPALDPEVRRNVERAAGELIPPGDTASAHALTAAGPLVLELLPGPDTLTDAQAHAVTVSASLLAEDEPDTALAVLRRFRGHPSLDVRRQLVGTWHRFHARQYMTEVLEHVDRSNLFLSCGTEEQLAALTAGSPWPSVFFEGQLALQDVDWSEDHRGVVDDLNISANGRLRTGHWLSGFMGLRKLWIQSCPNLRDLSVLPRLPLTEFMFCGGELPPELADLTELDWLHLEADLPPDGLAGRLPRAAPLRSLELGQRLSRPPSLAGLHRWPTLTHLGLMNTVPSRQDWAEIAALPLLTSLTLLSDPADCAVALPELPRVESLNLRLCSERSTLARYAEKLPHLREVRLLGEGTATALQRSAVTALLADLFPHTRASLGFGPATPKIV